MQATIERGFSLKHVSDMISTYTQIHRTDKNIESNAPYRQVLKTQLYHLESFNKWLSVGL